MKDRFLDDSAVYQMLGDDPFEQRRRDPPIPDPIRIHDDDRTTGAHTEARRFTALHSIRTEEESVPLKQRRQHLIELSTPAIRRTESADAYEHVSGIRVHSRQNVGRHEGG